MPRTYFRHLQRLYNVPLLIEPRTLDLLLPRWTHVLLGEKRMQTDAPSPSSDSAADDPPYDRIGPVAIFPVHGVLTQRGSYDASESTPLLGYNHIVAAAGMAAADPNVAATILEFDTPGGEAGGAFEAMRQLRIFSRAKPIYAAVNEMACSSGYGLAAACTKIYATDSSIIGSIGVNMRHADLSAMLENEGIAITELYSGARKVDGSPYRALSDTARANYQRDLDRLYDIFVDTTARHRSMSSKLIRDTEAATYLGQDAVAAGLVDEILPLSQLVERIMTESADTPTIVVHTPGTAPPPPKTGDAPAPPPPKTGDGASDDPKIVKEDPAAAALRESGAQIAQARIRTILISGHAAVLPQLAQHLAFETSLAAETATAVLAVAFAEISAVNAKHESPFEAAMTAIGDSGVASEFEDSNVISLSRAEFEKLDPAARREHIHAGGTVR